MAVGNGISGTRSMPGCCVMWAEVVLTRPACSVERAIRLSPVIPSGALVEVEYIFQSQDLSVGVERGAGMVALFARVVGGH
jgi:hypothetical protein